MMVSMGCHKEYLPEPDGTNRSLDQGLVAWGMLSGSIIESGTRKLLLYRGQGK